MMTMRRTRSLMVAGCVMSLILFSIGGSVTCVFAQETQTIEVPVLVLPGIDREPVEVVFWDFGAQPYRSMYSNEQFRRFEEFNPHINIKVVPIPSNLIREKAMGAIVAGGGPDVSKIQPLYQAEWVAMGALENLEPYIPEWENAYQIPDLNWEESRRTGGGIIYSIPGYQHANFLYYRKDWFEEKGLDAKFDEFTWDDFLTAAKKLTDPAKKRYGFAMRGGGGGFYPIVQIMLAGNDNKNWFDEEGNSYFDKPGAVAGLEWYANLFTKDKVCVPSAPTDGYMQVIGNFDGGAAAMVFHHLGSLLMHRDALGEESFDVLPFPTRTADSKQLTIHDQVDYGMWSWAKNKEECWELLEFMGEAEFQSYFAMGKGALPVNRLALEQGWVRHNEIMRKLIGLIEDPERTIMGLPFYLPECGEYSTLIMQEFQKVLLGEQTAKEFCEWNAQFLTKAQKGYLKRIEE